MYRFIYKYYYASVKSIVSGFKSLSLDPDDIFQDGLVTTTLNVENGRFNGESTFQTYLVAICRNICLKKLNRHKRMVMTGIENLEVIDEAFGVPEDQINRMMSLKALLEEKCREIINLRFGLSDTYDCNELSGRNRRFEEIASILGLEPDNARQRFNRCLGKLRTLMVNDHSLKMILSNS